MTFATAVLTAIGSPAAGYMSSAQLPPVESVRPERPKPSRYRTSGSGTTVVGGHIDSSAYDSNRETQGHLWYGSLGRDGISAKMMRHPHIRQSVAYITNPLRAATWRFKSASKSDLDREVADYCTWALIEHLPWDLILERMVRGYAQDGFALSEMTDEMLPIPADRFPHHPGDGTGLAPTGLHEIPANTVDYFYKRADHPTQLDRVKQWQPFSDEESPGYRDVPADRIVRLTLDQTGANFTGDPATRSVYGSWKMLRAFETFRSIGFERTAVGTPVVIAAEDMTEKEELDAIELLLENMRTMAKGSMVLPHGSELTWEGAGENDIANLNVAIESIKTDIAVNVSAGFSRLGLTGPGSYALGVTLANPYHLATVGHAKLVSIAFTLGLDGWSPVRRLVTANYGAEVPIPTLEARNLPTRDIKTTMPLLFQAVQSKIITPDDPLEEEIRELLQIGLHDPDTARKSAAPMPFAAASESEPDDDYPEPPDNDGVILINDENEEGMEA